MSYKDTEREPDVLIENAKKGEKVAMGNEYWGWHFNYFIKGGSHEDMDYTYKAFQKAVEERGLGFVHLDVHQAPNMTLGPLACLECRKFKPNDKEE